MPTWVVDKNVENPENGFHVTVTKHHLKIAPVHEPVENLTSGSEKKFSRASKPGILFEFNTKKHPPKRRVLYL